VIQKNWREAWPPRTGKAVGFVERFRDDDLKTLSATVGEVVGDGGMTVATAQRTVSMSLVESSAPLS